EAVASVPVATTGEDAEAVPTGETVTAALPVDEMAKDDGTALTVETDVAVEPKEQGDAIAVEPEAVSPEAVVPDAAAVAPSPMKDDDMATDLGGETVPISGAPKLRDEAAVNGPTVTPVAVAN